MPLDWTIEKVEEEPKQEQDPLTGKGQDVTSGIDWATVPQFSALAQDLSIGSHGKISPPEMYLMSRPCEWKIWTLDPPAGAMKMCGSQANYGLPGGTPVCELHYREAQGEYHPKQAQGLYKDCPPCSYCGGPDGILLLQRQNRNACVRCYGSSQEPVVRWSSSPAPKAYQVESPNPGTTGLWDFLMRYSFQAGQPKPEAWLKGKIDEWFKATGRGAQ